MGRNHISSIILGYIREASQDGEIRRVAVVLTLADIGRQILISNHNRAFEKIELYDALEEVVRNPADAVARKKVLDAIEVPMPAVDIWDDPTEWYAKATIRRACVVVFDTETPWENGVKQLIELALYALAFNGMATGTMNEAWRMVARKVKSAVHGHQPLVPASK
ncbi:MAG: hypothetical protein WC730_02385 [Patescibacteria group bacterium]|jgi:hypothetical protein